MKGLNSANACQNSIQNLLSFCQLSGNKKIKFSGAWRGEAHFLGLGTSWRWVVRFTPRPLYPRGKSPRYPLDRGLGGPQSRSGRSEKRKSWPYRTRTPTPRSSGPYPVATPTTLSPLLKYEAALFFKLTVEEIIKICFLLTNTSFTRNSKKNIYRTRSRWKYNIKNGFRRNRCEM
jgi:hypothetical protein